ncbi:MAG: phosphate acyltransferase PlsX [Planctomycetes bacterium]|nr:phosphate acyltransferase PlsX [Planctomycetota bacterium]
MRLAIDAMGNDRGPRPIVEGVKSFLEADRESKVILVGDRDKLEEELALAAVSDSKRYEIVHASQTVEMHEKVGALREKRDSSIMRLVELVKGGGADAMVALGNTAAAVGAASMVLRTLRDVHRPGIAVPMPTVVPDRPCVTIDMGANTAPKAQHLVDYGVMASIYCEKVLHISNPRVGLLNVGAERGKGNTMLREAYEALQSSSVNFIGNAEGGDIFNGTCDVVVCDGFAGNVILKASEELASAIMGFVKDAANSSPMAKLGALLMKPSLKGLKKQISYETYGGAPLLGINGICIIGHGRSSPFAVYNALRVAKECVTVGINKLIHEHIFKIDSTAGDSVEQD